MNKFFHWCICCRVEADGAYLTPFLFVNNWNSSDIDWSPCWLENFSGSPFFCNCSRKFQCLHWVSHIEYINQFRMGFCGFKIICGTIFRKWRPCFLNDLHIFCMCFDCYFFCLFQVRGIGIVRKTVFRCCQCLLFNFLFIW